MYKYFAVLLNFQKQYMEGNTPVKLISELAFYLNNKYCVYSPLSWFDQIVIWVSTVKSESQSGSHIMEKRRSSGSR